jgi:hypothetical protein
MTCADVEELAAELALGGVAGAERAAAVAHLAGCDNCRSLVDQLARAADSLLLLAPAAEPPPGFESKVLARIAVAAQPMPVRPLRPARRRLWLAAAAVAVAASLSAVGVAELRHGTSGGGTQVATAPAGVRTALVRDDGGRWTCRAVVYGDDPTWLVVSLDRTDGLNAAFSVEAVPAGNADAVPVGTFTLSDGHGSLATMVPLQATRFQSVRVLDASGHVRYEASFPATA